MHMHSFVLPKIKKRRIPSRITQGITALLIAAAPVAGWAHIARAESDLTPMELRNLHVSQDTATVDSGDVQVYVIGDIYDNLSGYGDVQFYYTSPSGNIVYEGEPGIVGDYEQYTGYVKFRQHTESGTWKPTITTKDASGNVEVLTDDILKARGTNLEVTVYSSVNDTSPPTLIDVAPESDSVTVGASAESFWVEYALDDNVANSGEVRATLVSPSGKVHLSAYSSYDSGSDRYTDYFNIPPYSEGGNWTLYSTVCDGAGNCTLYEPADMDTLQLPSSVLVVSDVSDTTPISINRIDITAGDPTFDTINVGGAAISALVDYSDDLSGVDDMYLQYYSPSTGQVSDYFGLSTGPDNSDQFYMNSSLPPYAATGLWLPRVYTRDLAGNVKVYEQQDLLGLGFDISFTLQSSTTDTVAADETVTSDTSGQGATVAEPIQAAVTTPTGGDVSIVKVDLTEDAITTPGYSLAGQQISISAPEASEAQPMTLTFTLDTSQIPVGETTQSIAIFRNAELIAPCEDAVMAIPNPCVYDRATLPDGDIQVTVHTAYASVWTMAFPDETAQLFQGFKNPVKDLPQVNKIEGGEVVAVKFKFGSNNDTSVLPEGNIRSQEIDCTTHEPIGPASAAIVNGSGVKANGQTTRFNWKTLKNWKHSCRQLNLTFSNGEVATAYFKFTD